MDKIKYLEETAEEWAENEAYGKSDAEFEMAYKGFIAGWKYRDDQMPMPEDTVLFNKGVAEGRRLEREDMLKDAEECELYWDGDFLAIDLNMVALGYSEKDKVRIVVLKEEEE